MSQAFWIFLSSCVGLYLLGLVAGSVMHEGGHLLCARVCSIPINRIVIGGGPVLMRLHVGKVQLEWRLLPVGGLVVPAALPNLQARGPMALFFFGGVLGNVAAIGTIILLHVMGAVPTLLYNDAGTPLSELQAGILMLTQAIFVILSPIPHWAPMDGRPMASDGLQLLCLLQGKLHYAVRLEPYRHGMTRPPSSLLALTEVPSRKQLHGRGYCPRNGGFRMSACGGETGDVAMYATR
jgi:Peptidase family M50